MVRRATIIRRRLAAASLAGLAAGAFAIGVALGDGIPPEPPAASRLSPSQLVGQRLVAGFPGTTVPAAVRRMIRRGRLAGVVLFAANLRSREAARELTSELEGIPHPTTPRDPLLVMIDQEGGEVKRVGGAPTVSARKIAARGPAFAREQGERTARNLRNLGVNVNLAPVLDVARPGGDIAATDRGFGSTPREVARTAIPFAAAMQDHGVAATAKHFPGLGAARANTDFEVQRIPLSRRALRRVDESVYRPFEAIGGELVMLDTAIYPALSRRPAAFSGRIARSELRGRLGFGGVTITDALGSVAARAFAPPAEAGVAAARAGADLLLYTDFRDAARARRALLRGLRSGALRRTRFVRSVQRVLSLRHRLRAPD